MSNAEQIDYWNGEAGQHWVAEADALDFMLRDVGEAVLTHAELSPGQRVLDVGCGSGALTLAVQERVGAQGAVVGLDISRPLVQNARLRASECKSRATFAEGDAAVWQTDTQFDRMISRFGVMFFDNPAVAFANLAKAIRVGGTLTFACWRSPKENDMGSGMMKAVSHLFTPPEVKPDPTAPGPFAFAEQSYVSDFLTKAGWHDVRFQAWDGRLPLTRGTAHENALALAQMGPVARTMREQHVEVDRVVEALQSFLARRCDAGRYYLNGAVWIVSARR